MPVAATNLRPEHLDAGLGQILGRVHAAERRQQAAVSVDAVRPRALGDQPEPALARRQQLLDEGEQREPVDRAQRLVASFAPDDHHGIAIGIEGRVPIGRPPPPRGTACRRRTRTPPRLARRSRASRPRGPRAAPARRRRRVQPRPRRAARVAPGPAPRRPRPATPPLPRPGRRGRRAAIPPSRGAPSARPSASTRRPRARSRPAGSRRSAFRGWRAAPRALLPGARRHARDLAPDAQPCRRQERVQELPRRDGRLGGGRRFGNVWGGGTRHTDPTPGPRGRNALGPGAGGLGGCWAAATVTLSTRTRQAVPGFPTGPTSQCAPKSCLAGAQLPQLFRDFHTDLHRPPIRL